MRHTDSRVERLRHPMISGRRDDVTGQARQVQLEHQPAKISPLASAAATSAGADHAQLLGIGQPATYPPVAVVPQPPTPPPPDNNGPTPKSQIWSKAVFATGGGAKRTALTDVCVQSIAVTGVDRYGFTDPRLRGQLPPLRGADGFPLLDSLAG